MPNEATQQPPRKNDQRVFCSYSVLHRVMWSVVIMFTVVTLQC